MSFRMTKLLALLVGFLFFGSLFALFYLNPQTYRELNNLSVASFNIVGMHFRAVAVSTLYAGTGIINIIFCIRLLREGMHNLVGKISLLIASVCWSSLALLPYNIDNPETYHMLLVRIIIFL